MEKFQDFDFEREISLFCVLWTSLNNFCFILNSSKTFATSFFVKFFVLVSTISSTFFTCLNINYEFLLDFLLQNIFLRAFFGMNFYIFLTNTHCLKFMWMHHGNNDQKVHPKQLGLFFCDFMKFFIKNVKIFKFFSQMEFHNFFFDQSLINTILYLTHSFMLQGFCMFSLDETLKLWAFKMWIVEVWEGLRWSSIVFGWWKNGKAELHFTHSKFKVVVKRYSKFPSASNFVAFDSIFTHFRRFLMKLSMNLMIMLFVLMMLNFHPCKNFFCKINSRIFFCATLRRVNNEDI